jgi:hypothetical protein
MTMALYSHRSTEADKAAADALQTYFCDALTDSGTQKSHGVSDAS